MGRKRWQLLMLTTGSLFYTVTDTAFCTAGAWRDIAAHAAVHPRLWTLASGLAVIRDRELANAGAVPGSVPRQPRPAGHAAALVALCAAGVVAAARAGLITWPWAWLLLAVASVLLWQAM